MDTHDTLNYNESLHHSGDKDEKPFLKKEMVYIIDNNNSTDYTRNQIVFDSISISNSGKWADFKNAYVSIPVVASLERTAGTQEAAGVSIKGLKFKSGPVMVDSVIVEMNNSTLVQQRKDISAYASFKNHTTKSLNDVEINGDAFNYYKPESTGWEFTAAEGMKGGDCKVASDLFNDVLASQEGALSAENVKASGADYSEKVGDVHYFYKDFKIKLSELILFDQMPMIRGANFKITLTLNQASIVSTYSVNGVLTSSVNTLKGSICPVLRCNVTGVGTASNAVGAITTEAVHVKVVSLGDNTHTKNQCRLYVPTYTMESNAEMKYLSAGVKKILYNDIFVTTIKNVKGKESFQNLISNSLSRMKRLIIVPTLNKDVPTGANVKFAPQESMFSSEPSVCSPCYIRDFNVALSGSNVYSQGIQFKYETFLDELGGGKFGVDAGLSVGTSSSLISLKDYESNYGYLVVDLSRRQKYDDNTPLSLEIKGTVASPLALDLLVFVEFERDVEVDLTTGAII